MKDAINPDHYKGETEAWEIMVAIYGEEEYKIFCKLNALKYRLRAGKKEGNSAEQDIAKALWYEEKMGEIGVTEVPYDGSDIGQKCNLGYGEGDRVSFENDPVRGTVYWIDHDFVFIQWDDGIRDRYKIGYPRCDKIQKVPQ